MRIVVTPDDLRVLATEMLRRAHDVRQLGSVSAAINNLDWLVRSMTNVDEMAGAVASLAELLAAESEYLHRRLSIRADEFDVADMTEISVNSSNLLDGALSQSATGTAMNAIGTMLLGLPFLAIGYSLRNSVLPDLAKAYRRIRLKEDLPGNLRYVSHGARLVQTLVSTLGDRSKLRQNLKHAMRAANTITNSSGHVGAGQRLYKVFLGNRLPSPPFLKDMANPLRYRGPIDRVVRTLNKDVFTSVKYTHVRDTAGKLTKQKNYKPIAALEVVGLGVKLLDDVSSDSYDGNFLKALRKHGESTLGSLAIENALFSVPQVGIANAVVQIGAGVVVPWLHKNVTTNTFDALAPDTAAFLRMQAIMEKDADQLGSAIKQNDIKKFSEAIGDALFTHVRTGFDTRATLINAGLNAATRIAKDPSTDTLGHVFKDMSTQILDQQRENSLEANRVAAKFVTEGIKFGTGAIDSVLAIGAVGATRSGQEKR